jgi:putative photosynthetic complex assembly protein
MATAHAELIPRGALIAAGALIATTLLAVGGVQIAKRMAPPTAADAGVEVLQERTLRFESQAGGETVVYDAATDAAIDRLKASDGFIRTVLVSFAFDRGKQRLAAEPVYRLVHWADGRVTIEDPATGVRINTGAFSPESKAVFRRFLPPAP